MQPIKYSPQRWLSAIVLITLLQAGFMMLYANAQPEKTDPAPSPWSPVETWANVKFATMGGEELHLNIYRPADTSATLPLIVLVHGGGWKGENFAEQAVEENTTRTLHARLEVQANGWLTGSKKGWPMLPFWMASRGYAMASISYRSSDKAHFPAQIEDCKAAIRWLRAHAEDYNFDPNRIGVWGGSAGGHLASLLGTSAEVADLEQEGPYKRYSSRVQAVCSLAGPSDFLDMQRRYPAETYAFALGLMTQLIGGDLGKNPEKVARANPITYITADDPPFLVMHGDKDRVVPISQSEIFNEALKKAGLDSTLYVVKGADHIFVNREADAAVGDFFDKHLKKTR